MPNKIKINRRWAFRVVTLIILAILSGCSHTAMKLLYAPFGIITNDINSSDIIGSWEIVNVNGEDPSMRNIQSGVVHLNGDGTLSYDLEMKQDAKETSIKNIGFWHITDESIVFTIGYHKGQSHISLDKNILTISPDFVVFSKSQTITTQYIKR